MTSNQKLSYSQRKDQNQCDQSKGCCYFSKKVYFYYFITWYWAVMAELLNHISWIDKTEVVELVFFTRILRHIGITV